MSAPDLILTRGRIRTLDEARPAASAVAIARGEITAVGADSEILGLADAGTERITSPGPRRLPASLAATPKRCPASRRSGSIPTPRTATTATT